MLLGRKSVVSWYFPGLLRAVGILVFAFATTYVVAQSGGTGEPSTAVSTKAVKNPIKMSDASARAGRQVYQRLCVTCHGIDGKGAPTGIDHLPAPPPDLTDKEWKYGPTDHSIYTIIREGTKLGMDPFKTQLNEQRTWHVVNYIRTLAKDSKLALEQEAVLENPVEYGIDSIRKGRILYENHCVLCHGTDGTGYTDYLDFLQTPPADFTEGEFKFGSRDGDLFKVIRDGTTTDMQAFKDLLSEENIWHTVNYVKRFSR